MQANKSVCVFITSLECLTAINWGLVKSEYFILSYIEICNEHTSSFVEVIDSEFNVKINELFDVDILPFFKG